MLLVAFFALHLTGPSPWTNFVLSEWFRNVFRRLFSVCTDRRKCTNTYTVISLTQVRKLYFKVHFYINFKVQNFSFSYRRYVNGLEINSPKRGWTKWKHRVSFTNRYQHVVMNDIIVLKIMRFSQESNCKYFIQTPLSS